MWNRVLAILTTPVTSCPISPPFPVPPPPAVITIIARAKSRGVALVCVTYDVVTHLPSFINVISDEMLRPRVNRKTYVYFTSATHIHIHCTRTHKYIRHHLARFLDKLMIPLYSALKSREESTTLKVSIKLWYLCRWSWNKSI